jgi:DNA-binding response OmpR family regulator
MVIRLKLKILALGNEMMLRRLKSRVDPDETEITGCSSTSEAAGLLADIDFDMVIIDSRFQDAEAVCRHINGFTSTPVVLMFRENAADWKQIRNLSVDGFLPEDAGNAELMARIKACTRRNTSC